LTENLTEQFDRKYDESSDDTVKNLDKGQDSIAFHRLISPFNDNCVPFLVHTLLSARLCALYEKSFAHLPISEIHALLENLLSDSSVTRDQKQVIEKLTQKQVNC
jgi:hypothetical protein